MSRPVIAEKSKGFAGNSAPSEVGLLCPDCVSTDDSDFGLFLSAVLIFSSKINHYARITYSNHK